MSKRLQKVVSVTTSITTILWLSGVAAFAPMAAFAATINEGDTIRVANTLDIYIAKYVGAKKFKRLILSPSVFNSYGHLSWSAVKTVTQAEMDAFTTSDLVRALGDQKVYKLTPTANSDNGGKQWLNMTAEAFTAGGYDWDSIYVINNTDRDVYSTGVEITGGTSTSPSTSASTSVAAGSLAVALASDTPAAGVAVENAARFPFTKVNFTAGASDVTITALTVQRTGLADDAALASIVLVDVATNLQVGLSQTLNASHQVVFRDTLTIPANTTKSYYLSANMQAVEDAYAGQIAALSLVGVTTSATISGVLPISGNGQTINATLAIGSATVSRGSLDPGADNASKEVGTVGFSFAGLKITAGSSEDVTVYSIKFNQSGSAAASDLANIVVSDGTTNYATTVSSDGKYYTASFGTAGLVIAKGLNKEFTVKGDILSGSGRTISFDVYRDTDIVVKGNTYGYYLTVAGTSEGATPADGAFGSGTPFYNAYDMTVSNGSIRVEKSSTGAPAANITKGAQGVLLGAFDFIAQGEAVNVTSLVLTMTMTGTTASSSDFTNITLTKADDTVVAGPVNGVDNSTSDASGTATFSGTISFPVGTTQILVKGNMSTDPAANATITTQFAASSVSGITGGTTGNSITAVPSSGVLANRMTVKAGSLVVSVSGTPVAQTVIRGITGYTFANYVFDASASGEDVKVTSVELQDIHTVAETELSSMQLFDGATALNTGSNVLNPSETGSATKQNTFTLDNALVIPKGTQKTIALKGNISGNATNAAEFTWGLKASATISATGVSTTQTIDATGTTSAQNGQKMTIATSGQYRVALDASTPTGKLVAANTTGNIMTVLKFSATSEQINVSKIRLALLSASSTANDLSTVYIYDGSTLLGSGVLGTGNAAGASANASSTFTLSTPLQIPANSDKIVTIKADIAPIYTTNTVATAGHQIAIDYYGSASTSENLGNGASSGQEVANYSVNTAQSLAYIYRSVPTVSKKALASNVLAAGSSVPLYKFSVAADAKGDIDLYKFTFQFATSSATLASIVLYDVTDSNEIVVNNNNTAVPLANTDYEFVLELNDTATTPRTVSAGTTRTFELRGQVSGTIASGSSVSTQMQGDATYDLASGTYMDAAGDLDGFTNNDFIWSDWSKASHSVSTDDWANGYLVSGLPSSNLASELVSK